MNPNDTALLLQQTALFHQVPLDDLQALAQVMQPRSYPQDALLFEAGDPGDSMYIIQAGRVRIFTTDSQGQELTLRHYETAEIFGEFALIDEQPRSASAAVASPQIRLFALQRADFMAFIQERPRVSIAMMQSLSQRARYTTNYLEVVIQWAKYLARGEYLHAIEEIAANDSEEDATDKQITSLVNAFLQMAKNVQEREARLQQEVTRLKIEIDQKKRKTDVRAITQTDFFANLKAQARQLRAETWQASQEVPRSGAHRDDTLQ